MIVINIPTDGNVSLPPDPRPRPSLQHTPAPNSTASSSASSGSSTPASASSSRRLSRRVQSMAVANLLSHDSPKLGASRTTSSSTSPAPASASTSTSDLKALKYELPADIAVPPFAQPSKDVERDLARLYEAVSGARRIAVICGAGISVSSPANIPDFRSAHGLFKKLKQKHPTAGLSSGKDLFDARLFSSESTSALFYSMVAELKRLADEAQPTIFHRFLKRLDDEGRLQRVYTQNIDGLEQKAGLTFGLGEAGDSTSTARALGKRKRHGGAWARSKSDSALLAAHRQHEQDQQMPMFPRTIPLHGTLQTLTCALCNHKVSLANTVHPYALDGDRTPASREGSAALGHEESKHAIHLLQNGEPVPCPRCETADEVRTSNGMRSRGVGRMKVDIVLYGGQNEGAERVGQCLQRDILGLRDPHEPPVPESAAEARARERREKKQAAKNAPPATEADASLDSERIVDAELGTLLESCDSKDDILARAFADDADAEPEPRTTPAKNVTIAEPVPVVAGKKRAPRPPRLKPLPPDLLIVAGTSLKVPGTKRIVREFAKACHAQDEWLIYSSSSEDESTGEDTKRTRTKPTPPTSTVDTAKHDAEEEDEIHDPSAPIRTMLFNYDFPNPAREWEDVFDVWIQGDLQRAALSLFPAKRLDAAASDEARRIEQTVSSHTWAQFAHVLEAQRQQAKKDKRKAALSLNAGRKRRFDRTVSAAAKMERTASGDSPSETPPPSSSAPAAKAKARSRSESPHKKRTPTPANATAAAGKRGGAKGLKRTNSKVNPFVASAGVTVEIPTITEEAEDETTTTPARSEKGRDGGKTRAKDVPSSSLPPSRTWTRAESGPELSVLIESHSANLQSSAPQAAARRAKPAAVYGKQRASRSGSVSQSRTSSWARTNSAAACL